MFYIISIIISTIIIIIIICLTGFYNFSLQLTNIWNKEIKSN